MVHFKLYSEKIWNFRIFEINLRLILICTDVLNLMKRCDFLNGSKSGKDSPGGSEKSVPNRTMSAPTDEKLSLRRDTCVF